MFLFKEQVLDYMVAGHVHLSKKDYAFFNNIKYMIQQKRPITSNQDKLFCLLISKYKKQIVKLGNDSNDFINLPWKNSVVKTSNQYLVANVFIDNNIIKIKSPYNTKFVQYIRESPSQHSFLWSSAERLYKGEFNTLNLKFACRAVKLYYDQIIYCDNIQKILEDLKQYEDVKYWHPTLVKRANNYFILGINSSLYEATKHIELNDKPETLFELAQYGIEVDANITNHDKLLLFASKFESVIDLVDIPSVNVWLKQLNIDMVLIGYGKSFNGKTLTEIKNGFAGIHVSTKLEDLENYKNPVLIDWRISRTISYIKQVKKKLIFVNSRPIDIK